MDRVGGDDIDRLLEDGMNRDNVFSANYKYKNLYRKLFLTKKRENFYKN